MDSMVFPIGMEVEATTVVEEATGEVETKEESTEAQQVEQIISALPTKPHPLQELEWEVFLEQTSPSTAR